MSLLKEKLSRKIPQWRGEIKELLTNSGSKVISEVTVEQAYGGMRGVRALVCDTSNVPPEKGLITRGIPIKELAGRLPEEIYWLLLTGELPNKDELASITEELQQRRGVPSYVWDVIKALPSDSHPMAVMSVGILAMEKESIFRRRYDEGLKKDLYWEVMLDDCLNLVARLPELAAGIYRMKYNKGKRINPNPKLDWAADYAYMLGLPDPTGEFANLMRLYMVLHSDHESGNVSAFTSHTVGSALSDVYYTLSAGVDGLAGPLHGLANQECLAWILASLKKFGGKVPSKEELRKYAWETLSSGRVIPGYGHAVLRITDPRFDAFLAFGKKVAPEDPIIGLVSLVFDVVPDVLKEQGKAKDPWPNMDAASGAVLYHFGLAELNYYTVVFVVSRALGITSQLVINRGIGAPITRPKSVTTKWIKEAVSSPSSGAL